MHPDGRKNAHDPLDENVVHAVYSTKGATRYFHGHCASRAEAEDLARAVTLPPHGHDLAYVRRSPPGVHVRGPDRPHRRSTPTLATVDGQLVGGRARGRGTV
jgi:hypothetical protein